MAPARWKVIKRLHCSQTSDASSNMTVKKLKINIIQKYQKKIYDLKKQERFSSFLLRCQDYKMYFQCCCISSSDDIMPTVPHAYQKIKSIHFGTWRTPNAKIRWTVFKFATNYIPQFNAHSKEKSVFVWLGFFLIYLEICIQINGSQNYFLSKDSSQHQQIYVKGCQEMKSLKE